MPSLENYSNSQSRALEKLAEQVGRLVLGGQKYYSAVPDQQAVVAAKKTAFATLLSERTASELVAALAELEQKIALVSALDDLGGIKQIRIHALNTPEVFELFVSGFSEKISALEKMLPTQRKRLGAERSALTENGISFGEIEFSLPVRAWREFGEAITQHIHVMIVARGFCEKRGVQCTPRSFDELLGELRMHLPVVPTIPATVAA